MKDFKSVVATALVAVMSFSIAGCAFFPTIKPVSMKEFKKAIKATDDDDLIDNYSELDEDDILLYYSNYAEDDIIGAASAYDYDGILIAYYQFEDRKAAADYYKDIYSDFEDWIEDDEFDGKRKLYKSGTGGYIVFDGEFEDVTFVDDYGVGGIYWADDMIIIARCESDKKKEIKKINAFIEELGYPAV